MADQPDSTEGVDHVTTDATDQTSESIEENAKQAIELPEDLVFLQRLNALQEVNRGKGNMTREDAVKEAEAVAKELESYDGPDAKEYRRRAAKALKTATHSKKMSDVKPRFIIGGGGQPPA